ncbi:MAG: hypothetical protein HKO96_09520 [Flavobacteriaceae bacterium]|nr:hypothetical protein [Flavobacteriaceae bacterium]
MGRLYRYADGAVFVHDEELPEIENGQQHGSGFICDLRIYVGYILADCYNKPGHSWSEWLLLIF